MRMVWTEKMDIIGVPEWDLFMMNIGNTLDHIDCAMTVTAKNPIY